MCSDIMGVEKYPDSEPRVLHQPQCWSENAADSVCLNEKRMTRCNYSSNMMFTRYESHTSVLELMFSGRHSAGLQTNVSVDLTSESSTEESFCVV